MQTNLSFNRSKLTEIFENAFGSFSPWQRHISPPTKNSAVPLQTNTSAPEEDQENHIDLTIYLMSTTSIFSSFRVCIVLFSSSERLDFSSNCSLVSLRSPWHLCRLSWQFRSLIGEYQLHCVKIETAQTVNNKHKFSLLVPVLWKYTTNLAEHYMGLNEASHMKKNGICKTKNVTSNQSYMIYLGTCSKFVEDLGIPFNCYNVKVILTVICDKLKEPNFH